VGVIGFLAMKMVPIFLLALAFSVHAAPIIPCGEWDYFYQCDSRWANIPLGTSSVDTICTAGCAMTSVCMALYKYNASVNNDICYPPNLNSWLNAHGGYVQQDLIVWNSVCSIRPNNLCMQSDTPTLDRTTAVNYIKNCQPIIANVRNGGHWVLLKGYDDANNNVFYCNDPYFSNTYYNYSDIVNWVVYKESKYLTPEEIAKMKVADLKAALKKRSLSVTGSKALLVERLQGYINGDIQPEKKGSGKRKATNDAGGSAQKKANVQQKAGQPGGGGENQVLEWTTLNFNM